MKRMTILSFAAALLLALSTMSAQAAINFTPDMTVEQIAAEIQRAAEQDGETLEAIMAAAQQAGISAAVVVQAALNAGFIAAAVQTAATNAGFDANEVASAVDTATSAPSGTAGGTPGSGTPAAAGGGGSGSPS